MKNTAATEKEILIFFLTCSVEDIKKGDFIVNNALFPV
jgi:hypothetical protein